MDADDPRDADPTVVEYSREFLSHSLPELANAPLAGSRACFYNDTWDGDFYITRHPEIEGLVVSTGGSGHAFKFTPALGWITRRCRGGQAEPLRRKVRLAAPRAGYQGIYPVFGASRGRMAPRHSCEGRNPVHLSKEHIGAQGLLDSPLSRE